MNPFGEAEAGRLVDALGSAEDLRTPALAVHLPSVRHNVARVLEAVGDASGWRPHLKTTKLPQIWQLLLDAGVERFKCATTGEMSALLELAPDIDVLLAHHPAPANLARLGELAAARPEARISTLVETVEAVEALPAGVGAFVDVNPGMNRTGIPLEDRERIELVTLACGDRWRGLHCYEGHIRDGSESSRRERTHVTIDRLLAIDAGLGGATELVTSGTPTFLHALAHAPLVGTLRGTVSPGTVVLHDAISERLPEIARLGLRPAAVVIATVVSRPAADMVTLDAGHKSVSADSGDPCCVILGEERLLPLHPSEEHLPVRVLSGPSPGRGERRLLAPEHVCPTVNLARHAVLLDDDAPPVVVDVRSGGHEAPLDAAPV